MIPTGITPTRVDAMCGIVGQIAIARGERIEESEIHRMLGTIRHRGPDQFGIYIEPEAGLGSARLSILDIEGGQQPISNEDGNLWIVYNGEVFNYLELRKDLEGRGHRFRTNTDTEVIVHLFEEYGPQCLERLNGQFAIAIWDTRKHALFLARDRLGVRPLFYTRHGGKLVFGSEIKAIFCADGIQRRINIEALEQALTFWSVQPPLTIFEDIFELPPGCFMTIRQGRLDILRWWEPRFPSRDTATHDFGQRPDDSEYLDAVAARLTDAVDIRLRADVPVGAYLSGGLDSSIIAALVRRRIGKALTTFSIAFEDPEYDETTYQLAMARHLGTDHQVIRTTYSDIGRVFPDVVWHAETPLLRTAPAPMFLLSERVRDSGFKVVLTGEGADEFFAGYDLFREAKVRRFWAAQPDSLVRPLLFKRLYRFVSNWDQGSFAFQKAFFRLGLLDTNARDYSHRPRWQTTGRIRRFLNPDRLSSRTQLGDADDWRSPIRYPDGFDEWTDLAKAQYLEVTTFLSTYLLSSQGDRMGMAHSVEGRFPFLDHRIVDLANSLPDRLKLRGMTEKYLLKKLGEVLDLPPEVFRRPKRPFRAPIQNCFFGGSAPDYVEELLSRERLAATGLFEPAVVGRLLAKVRGGGRLGETDEMALVAILSTQILQHAFIDNFEKSYSAIKEPLVKIHRAA